MSGLAEELREALAGRYEVDREIGKGANAVVFRVRDPRHDRWVALKVLRPELSSTLAAERFLREIRLAARLQHPHILPLYDSGQAGGLLYYVMPYVEGESLRARIERESQLPLDEALRTAREVAEALHYAHQHDIVHRDIKPENILLTGGHAVVADFGIARAITAAGAMKLTEGGLAVGTPAYMSPEQAGADPRVDGRSDVYALGCVLYEMLVGEAPFRGPSAQRIMAQHSMAVVPSVRASRPTVPEVVEAAINQALAKVPADRFATAEAFAAALTSRRSTPTGARTRARSILIAAVVFVAVSSSALVAARQWFVASAEEPVTVAVAPMRNLGDSADASLADGLTQELTTALTRIPRIAPRPYTTVALEAAKEPNPLVLGRKLGVEYVLQTTLRRPRGNIRLSAELIRVKDGTNIWSPRPFDGTDADLYRMQDSIVTRLARDLATNFSPVTIAAGRGRIDPEAYKLYLQAISVPLMGISASGSRQKVQLLNEALRLDSTFADAWAALADAYWKLGQYGGEAPSDLMRRRVDAVNRALALDSLNPVALMQHAFLKVELDWDYVAAERQYKRVLGLSPNASWTHGEYAKFIEGILLNHDSALAEIRRALKLDPTNSHYAMIGGWVLQSTGRLQEADSALDHSLALDEQNWVTYQARAEVARKRGQHAEAVRHAERSHRMQGPNDPFSLAFLGLHYGVAGRREEADGVVKALTELARKGSVEHAWFAIARLGAGDSTGVLDELEASANAREADFALVMRETAQSLWRAPRYQDLLRRSGLARYWKTPPVP